MKKPKKHVAIIRGSMEPFERMMELWLNNKKYEILDTGFSTTTDQSRNVTCYAMITYLIVGETNEQDL
jgi:hypothetical protein